MGRLRQAPFRILADQGVIASRDLTERLQAMARFRNLLVHRYWEIDYRRVWTVLSENLELSGNSGDNDEW